MKKLRLSGIINAALAASAARLAGFETNKTDNSAAGKPDRSSATFPAGRPIRYNLTTGFLRSLVGEFRPKWQLTS